MRNGLRGWVAGSAGLIAVCALASACKSDTNVAAKNGNDTFAQSPNNELDILFVVDNSFSMAEEQQALVDGFDSFISEIENTGTDFHLGVISTSFEYTDPTRGTLLGTPSVLTQADDYKTLFKERVQIGIDGSDKEKGLEAASYALSPALATGVGPNAGFLRSEAQLLVVIVSDEEDCSDRGALEGEPPESCYTDMDKLVPVETFVHEFQQLKSSKEFFSFGSIVGVDSSCPDAYPGSRYMAASGLTHGLVGDICNPDWSNMLYDLGLNAASVKTTFQLEHFATDGSIEVYVDNDGSDKEPADATADDVLVEESESNGWTYDAEYATVTFHGNAVPPRGATLSVLYTIGPGDPPAMTETTGM